MPGHLTEQYRVQAFLLFREGDAAPILIATGMVVISLAHPTES